MDIPCEGGKIYPPFFDVIFILVYAERSLQAPVARLDQDLWENKNRKKKSHLCSYT